MKIINASPARVIPLGIQGENLAVAISFDLTSYHAEYGAGQAQLLVQRSEDKVPYPVNLKTSDHYALWEVSKLDASIPGFGRAELRWSVGEVLVKSATYSFCVFESLGEASAPPEMWETWLDEILEAASDLQTAATNTLPYIDAETQNWYVWSAAESRYIDTGISAKGTAGPQGEQGGWYTPAVTQPYEDTLRMSFTPSKEGMPAVKDADITLPAGGGGLSSTERSTLIAVVNAIGAFNVTNGQELIDAFNDAWVQKIPATGITLSDASLSFTTGTSQALIATVEPSDSTDTVVWSSSNPAVATVSNGVVTPVSNGDCVITATAGSVSASCAVNVAFATEVVYYTIANNLTNCTSNNSAESVVDGGSYTANLTADDGYTLDGASVSVVVNGEDVTDTAYSNGVITVHSVTGNVVITVAAVEEGAVDGGEVTMLSYIESDGNQYIDTEVIPTFDLRYEVGYQMVVDENLTYKGDTTSNNIFGACQYASNAAGSYGYMTMYTANNGVYMSYQSSQNGIYYTYNGNIPYFAQQIMHVIGSYVKNDDGTILQQLQAFTDEEHTNEPAHRDGTTTISAATLASKIMPIIPIHLFKVNVVDGGYYDDSRFPAFVGKIVYFKVYDDVSDELLHEFRAAKQNGVGGMYDTVTGKFHGNLGTGAFTLGEEVSA